MKSLEGNWDSKEKFGYFHIIIIIVTYFGVMNDHGFYPDIP